MVEQHSAFRIRRQAFNGQGNNSMILDLVPGTETVAFVSAIVVGQSLWLFGTNGAQVHAFSSSDPDLLPASWEAHIILQLPQDGLDLEERWTAYNTAPTKGKINGKDMFVLAIELGSPASLIGKRFTSVFAVCEECALSNDLSKGWQMLANK